MQQGVDVQGSGLSGKGVKLFQAFAMASRPVCACARLMVAQSGMICPRALIATWYPRVTLRGIGIEAGSNGAAPRPVFQMVGLVLGFERPIVEMRTMAKDPESYLVEAFRNNPAPAVFDRDAAVRLFLKTFDGTRAQTHEYPKGPPASYFDRVFRLASKWYHCDNNLVSVRRCQRAFPYGELRCVAGGTPCLEILPYLHHLTETEDAFRVPLIECSSEQCNCSWRFMTVRQLAAR